MRSRRSLYALLAVSALLPLAASCQSSSGAPAADSKATPQSIAPLTQDAPRPTTEQARQEKLLATHIGRLLEKEHLRRRNIDDAVSREAFQHYLEALDPTRSFLLAEDVKALERHADKIDDEIHVGDLALARIGNQLLVKRTAFVKKSVAELLAAPLDLSNDESLETDSEKRPWCASEAELRERWRQILELQLLQRVERIQEADRVRAEADTKQGKEPQPARAEADVEKEAREKLARDYSARFTRMEQQDHTDSTEILFNALASVYDPHTTFLPPARKENFDIAMSGSLEGIGATLQESESYIKVVAIVPGSASWRQGQLEAGDLIYAVAQQGEEPVDVVGMRLRDVVRMIRGPKGTKVTLTIKKPDDRTLIVPIVRDVVKIDETYTKGAVLQHPGVSGKIGYIDVPSFYGNTRNDGTPDRHCTDDVRALLDAFVKQGVDAVILDLRGNSGGLLSDAQRMSGLFIDQGPIVQTETADGKLEVLADTDPSVSFKGRVVVLVDAFSASASEIVAGALQDYGRAIVVGTNQTHGKGTVQQLLNLDRFVSPAAEDAGVLPLGVLKLTRQQFFRVTGSSTQNKGVVPDIVLPDPWAHIDALEKDLDNAIAWSSVDAVEYKVWAQKWEVNALRAASQKRQRDNDAFKLVERRTALLRERKKLTVEPLKAESWRALHDKEKKELEALSPDADAQPLRLAVEQLDYDGAIARQKQLEAQDPKRKIEELEEGATPVRKDAWKHSLERDAWVEEAIFILRDMQSN